MTEKELILQLKTLKNIQPEKNWTLNTKTRILGQNSNPVQNVVNWIKNRAFLIVPGLASLTLICFTGLFLYNNVVSLKTAELDAKQLETMALSLNTIESNLLTATVNLEKIQEPDKMLEVQESVSLAIETSKRIVSGLKSMMTEEQIIQEQESQKQELLREKDSQEQKTENEQEPSVFTVLNEVESAAQDLEQTMLEKQKNLAGKLIIELGVKSLTQDQEALLEQAKQDYDNQDFKGALVKAIQVSQVRQYVEGKYTVPRGR